ncbi:MAG: hypothetical protein V2A34_16490, partial [Lentisphaerota bacterium]
MKRVPRQCLKCWFILVLMAAAFHRVDAQTAVLTSISCSNNYTILAWNTGSNAIYHIDSASSPAAGSWQEEFYTCFPTQFSTVRDLQTFSLPALFYRVGMATNGAPCGQTLLTYIPSDSGERIALKILVPTLSRFPARRAGVLVNVSGFVKDSGHFQIDNDFSSIGLIHITYLWPGAVDGSGVASDGSYDYGGTNCIRALKQVLRFAGGQIPDLTGRYLADLVQVIPLYDNVGMFAASHAGIGAVNALFHYGREVTNVAYYVGWENPTVDTLVAWDAGNIHSLTPLNPLYRYPASWSATNIEIGYERIWWSTNFMGYALPFFDLNTNYIADPFDYILPEEGSEMFGKRFYSRGVLHALTNNGALAATNWPAGLATPEEADEIWSYRNTPAAYETLITNAPQLRAMLLCAVDDHMQPALDKPHVHHNFNGFHNTAGLWTRLNPDRHYAAWINTNALGAPDNPANFEPLNWMNIRAWSYSNDLLIANEAIRAGAAEMADRVFTTNWT